MSSWTAGDDAANLVAGHPSYTRAARKLKLNHAS